MIPGTYLQINIKLKTDCKAVKSSRTVWVLLSAEIISIKQINLEGQTRKQNFFSGSILHSIFLSNQKNEYLMSWQKQNLFFISILVQNTKNKYLKIKPLWMIYLFTNVRKHMSQVRDVIQGKPSNSAFCLWYLHYHMEIQRHRMSYCLRLMQLTWNEWIEFQTRPRK